VFRVRDAADTPALSRCSGVVARRRDEWSGDPRRLWPLGLIGASGKSPHAGTSGSWPQTSVGGAGRHRGLRRRRARWRRHPDGRATPVPRRRRSVASFCARRRHAERRFGRAVTCSAGVRTRESCLRSTRTSGAMPTSKWQRVWGHLAFVVACPECRWPPGDCPLAATRRQRRPPEAVGVNEVMWGRSLEATSRLTSRNACGGALRQPRPAQSSRPAPQPGARTGRGEARQADR
jgi:hypothetical protein